jgi:hypothetical protein
VRETEAIVVSGAFDMQDLDLRDGQGIWTPFYQFQVNAKSYVARSKTAIRQLAGADMGYVEMNGVVVASGDWDVMYGESLDAAPRRIGQTCKLVEEVGAKGECVLALGFLVAFTCAVVFLIATIGLIAVAVTRTRRARGSQAAINGTGSASAEQLLPDLK